MSNDPPSVGTLINRAGECEIMLDHEEALDLYSEAIRRDPTRSLAFSGRAAVYNSLGQRESALTDYETAIKLDSFNWQAYFNRGLFYHQNGEYDLAAADWTKAMCINPGYTLFGLERRTIDNRVAAVLLEFMSSLQIGPDDEYAKSYALIEKKLRSTAF